MAIKTFTTGEVLTASDTNTYLANSGLVYVASKTWTSTTNAQQIDSCFTSTYDNYRLVLTATSNQSTPAYMYYQMVDGTTAYAGAQYFANPVYSFTGGAPTANWNTFVTVGYAGWIGDNNTSIIFDISSPQVSGAVTVVNGSCVSFATSNALNGTIYGFVNQTTQYEGIKLGMAAGVTWAGTATIFGYRKA
jgi:hypothetical protein